MKKLLYLVLVLGLATYFESCKEDDPCETVNCLNGGTCSDGTCTCPNGYEGATCQLADSCIINEVTCENDGECLDGKCDCKTNYYGETCTDKCVRGEYEDGDCACDQGVEGESCEYISRRRFCGIYVLESALVGSSGSNLVCTIDSAKKFDEEIWKVSITNLSSKNDANGYAEIEGNKITVPQQTVTDKDKTEWVVKSDGSAQWSSQGFTIRMGRRLKTVQDFQYGDYKYTPNTN